MLAARPTQRAAGAAAAPCTRGGRGRMDLLSLRCFQAVARHQHISRAADELRVAQPSVSRTIARLEAEPGVPLFDRRGRRIQLNRHGTARPFCAGSSGRWANWRTGSARTATRGRQPPHPRRVAPPGLRRDLRRHRLRRSPRQPRVPGTHIETGWASAHGEPIVLLGEGQCCRRQGPRRPHTRTPGSGSAVPTWSSASSRRPTSRRRLRRWQPRPPKSSPSPSASAVWAASGTVRTPPCGWTPPQPAWPPGQRSRTPWWSRFPCAAADSRTSHHTCHSGIAVTRGACP